MSDIVSSLELELEWWEEGDKGNRESKKMVKGVVSEGERMWEMSEKIVNWFEYSWRFRKRKSL